MVQYESYSSVPQQVRDIVANKCKLLDLYIVFQTGDNEYTALIHDQVSQRTTKLVFSRSSTYGVYSVRVDEEAAWEFTVSNEYYVYSNVGYGSALDLPVVDGLAAHSLVFLTCIVCFWIFFRSVLFKRLRR